MNNKDQQNPSKPQNQQDIPAANKDKSKVQPASTGQQKFQQGTRNVGSDRDSDLSNE